MTLSDYIVQAGLALLLLVGTVCFAIPDGAIPGVWTP